MIRSCAAFWPAWIDPGRQHAALLRPGEQGIDVSPAASRPGEDIGGGDRVLDREVDADAADRRHGVGGIADRQQAGPMPARQPVERDRQQVEVG